MYSRRTAGLALAPLALLGLAAAPHADAQTPLSRSGAGTVQYGAPSGPDGPEFFGQDQMDQGSGSFNGTQFYGADGFSLTLSPANGFTSGTFGFNAGDEYLQQHYGDIQGSLTSGSLANGTFTGDWSVTSGTGIFAGYAGSGTIKLAGLPPIGSPDNTLGSYTSSLQANLYKPNAAVPEAGSAPLLGLGLIPLALLARRRLGNKAAPR